jgi:hypothetical protein
MFNKGSLDLGIASLNLIEELYENLLKIKEKDLDIEEVEA